MAIEKIKILWAVLELSVKQHCQFGQFGPFLGKKNEFKFVLLSMVQTLLANIHCYLSALKSLHKEIIPKMCDALAKI